MLDGSLHLEQMSGNMANDFGGVGQEANMTGTFDRFKPARRQSTWRDRPFWRAAGTITSFEPASTVWGTSICQRRSVTSKFSIWASAGP